MPSGTRIRSEMDAHRCLRAHLHYYTTDATDAESLYVAVPDGSMAIPLRECDDPIVIPFRWRQWARGTHHEERTIRVDTYTGTPIAAHGWPAGCAAIDPLGHEECITMASRYGARRSVGPLGGGCLAHGITPRCRYCVRRSDRWTVGVGYLCTDHGDHLCPACGDPVSRSCDECLTTITVGQAMWSFTRNVVLDRWLLCDDCVRLCDRCGSAVPPMGPMETPWCPDCDYVCDNCGVVIAAHDHTGQRYDHYVLPRPSDGLCDSCARHCNRCGERIDHNGYSSVCGECRLDDAREHHVTLNYSFKPQFRVFDASWSILSKAPGKRHTYGFELELEGHSVASTLYGTDAAEIMYAKHDASIDCGAECVSEPFTRSWYLRHIGMLSDMIEELAYADAYDTSGTGLHVHVGKHNLPPRALWAMVRLAQHCRRPMAAIGGRSASNSWSHFGDMDYDSALALARGKTRAPYRSVPVNLLPADTVECRYPRATIDADTFHVRLQHVMSLADYAQAMTAKNYVAGAMAWRPWQAWALKRSEHYPHLAEFLDSAPWNTTLTAIGE